MFTKMPPGHDVTVPLRARKQFHRLRKIAPRDRKYFGTFKPVPDRGRFFGAECGANLKSGSASVVAAPAGAGGRRARVAAIFVLRRSVGRAMPLPPPRAAAVLEQDHVRGLPAGVRQQPQLQRPHEHHLRAAADRPVSGDLPPRRGVVGGRPSRLHPPGDRSRMSTRTSGSGWTTFCTPCWTSWRTGSISHREDGGGGDDTTRALTTTRRPAPSLAADGPLASALCEGA